MKKSILALMVALVLSLCLLTGACAETAAVFPFTAEEYAAAFVELNEGAVINEDEAGYVTLEYEEGSPVKAAFNAQGQCTAVSTQVTVGLDDSEGASAAGVKLGMSSTKLLYVTRYLELDKDEEAVEGETNDMVSGFAELMSSMTDEDYTAMIEAPVVKETTISGHPATLTMAFDVMEMALVMTVTYLP
ncbi:MAG: hypothetical protein IKC28_06535 [Clostridia bacterium]|nr:hypothetical protein [Clostridia bacterium]